MARRHGSTVSCTARSFEGRSPCGRSPVEDSDRSWIAPAERRHGLRPTFHLISAVPMLRCAQPRRIAGPPHAGRVLRAVVPSPRLEQRIAPARTTIELSGDKWRPSSNAAHGLVPRSSRSSALARPDALPASLRPGPLSPHSPRRAGSAVRKPPGGSYETPDEPIGAASATADCYTARRRTIVYSI